VSSPLESEEREASVDVKVMQDSMFPFDAFTFSGGLIEIDRDFKASNGIFPGTLSTGGAVVFGTTVTAGTTLSTGGAITIGGSGVSVYHADSNGAAVWGTPHPLEATIVNNGNPANTIPISVAVSTAPDDAKAVAGWFQNSSASTGADQWVSIQDSSNTAHARSDGVRHAGDGNRGTFVVPLDSSKKFHYKANHADVNGVYIYARWVYV
jgi:hypothetical protein